MPFQKKSKVNRHVINNSTNVLRIFFSLLEVSSGASYEANKEAAKNENLSAGSRIGHGIDAVKDKGNKSN